MKEEKGREGGGYVGERSEGVVTEGEITQPQCPGSLPSKVTL